MMAVARHALCDLVDKDRRFQDYIIVHELLHLRVPNHGRLFKALMAAPVPAWRRMGALVSRRPGPVPLDAYD